MDIAAYIQPLSIRVAGSRQPTDFCVITSTILAAIPRIGQPKLSQDFAQRGQEARIQVSNPYAIP